MNMEACVGREPIIRSTMSQLKAIFGNLEETITQLEKRLEVIMSIAPSPSVSKCGGELEIPSPLFASEIKDMIHRAETINERVNSILGRLEI